MGSFLNLLVYCEKKLEIFRNIYKLLQKYMVIV